ncbi:MAG: GGDEF domain-containing protein [Rhodocyclaceae bacterium]|nr:MAG: GGDEF domain-containing protein [Rhodocyclaceae bacterium]
MHPLTLRFDDAALERAFLGATMARTRLQGQLACLVGMFVYILHGVLDQWFVAPEQAAQVWLARGTALCVPTLVLLVSLTPWFNRYAHLMLALVGMAAGAGLIAMQLHLPLQSAPYYYPMMVVVTFYTYNFVGTRFIYALCVDLLMLAAYNLLFGLVADYPPHIMIGHDFFIVSANLIGGSAGYLAERQRRLLFLREQELDAERRHHQQRALHDGLTGLPNRDLLYDRILKARDDALREGALRLKTTIRASDTVARIGGDEFFVLAENIGNQDAAHALARKLLHEIAAPFAVLPEHARMGASIGLCLFPYDGMNVADLIHRADEAMYRVKTSGKGNFLVAQAPTA